MAQSGPRSRRMSTTLQSFTASRSCFEENIIYRPMHVPVDSYIADRRVSCVFNLVQAAALALGALYALARSRAAVPVHVGSNMWMNQYLERDVDDHIARGFPSYCDNPMYNFRYDAYWDYSNITCRALPLSQMFVKSLTKGTYFITTMVQRQRGIACPGHDQPAATADVCFPIKNSSETEFMIGIEDFKLAATVSISVPELGCEPCKITTPTTIDYGNGTTLNLDASDGATPDFTVGRWVELFGISGGLDGTNELVRVKDSVGDARHRHVGMGIEISVTVKNTYNVLEVPPKAPDRLRVHWTITKNRDWNRLVLQDKHDLHLPKDERLQSTDLYGLRIKWEMAPSEVYVFSWFNFAMGVIDCVVVLNISKLLAIQVALWLCGRQSKQWREALRSPIDHVMAGREVARKTIIARNSSVSALNKVAPSTSPSPPEDEKGTHLTAQAQDAPPRD